MIDIKVEQQAREMIDSINFWSIFRDGVTYDINFDEKLIITISGDCIRTESFNTLGELSRALLNLNDMYFNDEGKLIKWLR